jgi:sedoheptulose-bisphosphatase
VTGGDQVAAAMGIYGPRTTYIVALKDCPGTHEFLLLDEGKWQHVKDTTTIGEGKMFSPGNLRATFDNPEYDKVLRYWLLLLSVFFFLLLNICYGFLCAPNRCYKYMYLQLINYYVKEKYTLRYTGGMVPDVNQVHTYISQKL